MNYIKRLIINAVSADVNALRAEVRVLEEKQAQLLEGVRSNTDTIGTLIKVLQGIQQRAP